MSAVTERREPVIAELDAMIERLDVLCARAAEQHPDEPTPELDRELLRRLRRIVDVMKRGA